MKKLLSRFLLLVAAGFVAYLGYDYIKAGLHTRPEMPDGAFSLSFAGGPRVILKDTQDERATRRYLARRDPGVPEWFEGAWSYCDAPTEDEAESIYKTGKPGPGMRLDGICALDADGDIIPTALIFSVPKL
jgi:hypothetical protein